MRRLSRWILLACIVLPLAACGSEKGHVITADYSLGVSSRMIKVGDAWDDTNGTWEEILTEIYPLREGKHCRVFLEAEQKIHSDDLDKIIHTFDSAYPKLINAFSEDVESIGMDKRIYIILFDAGGAVEGAILSGFFDPQILTYGFFNNNKYIFLNTRVLYGNGPYWLGKPNPETLDTMMHEFQHLIHWSVTNTPDKTSSSWLNEAMSEMAPSIAFGRVGPGEWERVKYFTDNSVASQTSLTIWEVDLQKYAIVYMWGQYMYDRFGPKVFYDILNQSSYDSGINAVEKYLNAQSPPLTFDEVFEDWSMANIYGNNTGPIRTDNPVWRYKSIDTWAGNQGGVRREGLFGLSRNQFTDILYPPNLPVFEPYSMRLFVYHPGSYPGYTGLTWPSAPGTLTAGIHDTGPVDYFTNPLLPGDYTFGEKSYLAIRNLSTTPSTVPITLYK